MTGGTGGVLMCIGWLEFTAAGGSQVIAAGGVVTCSIGWLAMLGLLDGRKRE
ncbi:hypothetical protein P0W64_19195 [Tsukamurella sp. 8F]|uniref:hypothetical protein n=1 Tax=unclassified Tsukamurella TaxID=2633480 RepID=UPI0023B96B94|nr:MULTISPECIES: hypothetical protein [unclassified Tsukamurella]MDF0531666.1 hypothetical protein [Tsukamurella sp. 8J]MDF0588912.1 hypothetical protein [Tsukamurella sp. 8F]